MIFSLILLGLTRSVSEDQTQLIITQNDLTHLVDTEILDQSKAEEVWQVLITQAEKTDPSRISATGFNISTEYYIFGVIPTISLIISLGALSIFCVLMFLLNAVDSFNNNILLILFTAVSSVTSLTISFTLYEASGVVLVTWILTMTGFWFLCLCLKTILISFKLLEENYSILEFNKYLAGVAAVMMCIGYYYSLMIGFPLFQVPFFGGMWYLVGFGQTVIKAKYKEHDSLVTPLSFMIVSVFILGYLGMFGQRSFIFIDGFNFVDFRFLAFVTCSAVYLAGMPMFFYKLYCKMHKVDEESVGILFNKYMNAQIPQTWDPYHYFIFYNFLGMAGFLVLGFVMRSAPMIVAGYLGSLLSILSMPVSKHSNLVYHVIYITVFLVIAILGYLSDPSFNQFLVYYPKSYILSIGYLVIRILLIFIGLVACNRYRTTHFTVHTNFDFLLDFISSYVHTVMLIVFSEYEPNFVMSWAYFLLLIIQLEPVIKVDPESYLDNTVKAFSMLLFGLRLTSLAYSSWILTLSSLLIILIGLFHLSGASKKTNSSRIVFYVYLYLTIQYACCLSSWTVLIIICVVSNIHIDYQDFKKSNVARSVVFGLLMLVFSFFVSIKSICSVTCHSASVCSMMANPDGKIIEKEILEYFLDYLNGSLG